MVIFEFLVTVSRCFFLIVQARDYFDVDLRYSKYIWGYDGNPISIGTLTHLFYSFLEQRTKTAAFSTNLAISPEDVHQQRWFSLLGCCFPKSNFSWFRLWVVGTVRSYLGVHCISKIDSLLGCLRQWVQHRFPTLSHEEEHHSQHSRSPLFHISWSSEIWGFKCKFCPAHWK